ARAIVSSVHFPAPVSTSGVMLGAIRNGMPKSAHLWPAPFFWAIYFPPGNFQSESEWHMKQCIGPSTRYRARSSRSTAGWRLTGGTALDRSPEISDSVAASGYGLLD